jgi:predicted esterase
VLLPGGYRLRWRCYEHDAEDEIGLTVLPAMDPDQLRERLRGVQDQISPGSMATLAFRLEEIIEKLATVRPYEVCGLTRLALTQWLEVVDAAANGQDILAGQTGTFRRAFRSAIDDTLQPYSVCVPADYDPAKRYPLLVALHGSGMDDRGFLERAQAMIPDDFIAIAPSARGISHYYCPPEAQQDIQEAIADVAGNYAVDTGRMVLIGFSMGGYGVFRTHYETPGRYRALAAFSGGLRLPSHADEMEGPNFLDDETMQCLLGVPLFIFHGRQDRNVPIDDMLVLVDQLRASETPIEVHIDEGAGHSIPDPEVIQAYLRWLRHVVGFDA